MPKGFGRPYNADERRQAARTKGPLGFLLNKAGPRAADKTRKREAGQRAGEQNVGRNISHAMGGSAATSSGSNVSPRKALGMGLLPDE